MVPEALDRDLLHFAIVPLQFDFALLGKLFYDTCAPDRTSQSASTGRGSHEN